MSNLKRILPVFITLFVVFLFYFKRFVFLKYYPPVCNFTFFLIFFISLFTKETVIQKIARACGDKLEPPAFEYTRKITYVWCVFLFLNFSVSLITVFLPDNIWILYNGFISYLLVGIMFMTEYSVRLVLRKRKLI